MTRPNTQPPPAAVTPTPRGRSRRGLILWLTAGALAVIVAAGAGLVILRPGPVDRLLGGAGRNAAIVPDQSRRPPPDVLDVPAVDAPKPTADGITRALAPLLADRRLGGVVTASVVDVASGETLFTKGADQPMTPASTNKVVTAVAALAARGPDHRIQTRVVAGAEPGEVVIIGAGDPTLSAFGQYKGAATLADLAAQVKRALGDTKATKVIVDNSLYTGPTAGPAWDADALRYYGAPMTALMTDGARQRKGERSRYREPDLAAGRAFAKLLDVPSSDVTRGQAPDGTEELAKVASPPLVSLVETTLTTSDNVLAEALARQVAVARGKPASFADAAAAVHDQLAELNLPLEQVRITDGSGLSRDNRLTPELLTAILMTAASDEHPKLRGVYTGLPIAAYTGTLSDRYDGTTRDGAGIVRAKTGRLSGVSSLAGIVVDADGRLLAFALVANQVPAGGANPAETALDRIAATLATCGCT